MTLAMTLASLSYVDLDTFFLLQVHLYNEQVILMNLHQKKVYK